LKQADKQCELHCEQCDIPVCSTCVSNKHRGHILCGIQEKLGSKTQDLQRDLEELETQICPRYEEVASDAQTDRAGMERKYGELVTMFSGSTRISLAPRDHRHSQPTQI
jgi:hypothetical protein